MQKICKECGEVFEATSAKQQYCSKLHFRPCPVCGKPVPAKYLSDPARCCSKECSSKRSSDTRQMLPKSVATSSVVTAESQKDDFITPEDAITVLVSEGSVFFRGTYVGPCTCGFIKDHIYDVSITRNAPYYEVIANKDVTADASVENLLYLSSLLSVKHYFKNHFEV